VETLTGMVGSSQACRLGDVMTHFCHLFHSWYLLSLAVADGVDSTFAGLKKKKKKKPVSVSLSLCFFLYFRVHKCTKFLCILSWKVDCSIWHPWSLAGCCFCVLSASACIRAYDWLGAAFLRIEPQCENSLVFAHLVWHSDTRTGYL
jgi:hypothetical protein